MKKQFFILQKQNHSFYVRKILKNSKSRKKRLLTLEIQCCCEVKKKDPRRIIELFLFRIGSCLRQ